MVLAILLVLANIIYMTYTSKRIANLQHDVDALSDHVSTLYDHQITLSKDQLRLAEIIEYWLDTWQIGTFESSAYSPLDDQNGLNSWGDGSVMASGARTADHIDSAIAVDPEVIPLGSRVWIQGIGWRTALDTGGAIRGKKIDIAMRSFDEAVQYGRKQVLVIYPKEASNERL